MKTIKIRLLVALFALFAGTTSCLDDVFIEGNGIRKSEFRNDEGFDEVALSSDFRVTVVPGSEYSVEVTAESNLLPYIETRVNGRKLKITTHGVRSLRQNYPIEVHIITPVLSGLALSGSGIIETGSFLSDDFEITVSGSGDIDTQVSADKIKANISGSGTVHIEGDALETNFVISGSGKIKTYNLEQNYCLATISGSGDMFVNVSQSIDANISGSGHVFYVNHPMIRSSISGSGSVINKN
ncbi:MAG: DUF2807 domain-containing protein [Prolixibacteraceae bacterium]|nr:DUF2807 domain-containing protein [Prolixibacteraceae bacterium]